MFDLEKNNIRISFNCIRNDKGEPVLENFGRGIQSFPKVIYKFRSWENINHKTTINKLNLYAASSTRFNDPFDSSIIVHLNQMKLPRQVYKESIASVIKKQYSILNRQSRKKIINNPKSKKIFEGKLWVEEKKHIIKLIRHIQNNVGIISFAGNKENILLWSHYADAHKGFCLGFDRDEYFEISLKYAPTQFRRIIYTESLPAADIYSLLDEDLIFKIVYASLSTKSINWMYEEELRSFFLNQSNFNLHFEPSCLKEIILGCNMPDSSKKEILEIAKENFSNVVIYQAEKHDEKYELLFRRII
jgi:hypothetical protein